MTRSPTSDSLDTLSAPSSSSLLSALSACTPLAAPAGAADSAPAPTPDSYTASVAAAGSCLGVSAGVANMSSSLSNEPPYVATDPGVPAAAAAAGVSRAPAVPVPAGAGEGTGGTGAPALAFPSPLAPAATAGVEVKGLDPALPPAGFALPPAPACVPAPDTAAPPADVGAVAAWPAAGFGAALPGAGAGDGFPWAGLPPAPTARPADPLLVSLPLPAPLTLPGVREGLGPVATPTAAGAGEDSESTASAPARAGVEGPAASAASVPTPGLRGPLRDAGRPLARDRGRGEVVLAAMTRSRSSLSSLASACIARVNSRTASRVQQHTCAHHGASSLGRQNEKA